MEHYLKKYHGPQLRAVIHTYTFVELTFCTLTSDFLMSFPLDAYRNVNVVMYVFIGIHALTIKMVCFTQNRL